MSVTQLIKDLPTLCQIVKPSIKSEVLSERLNSRYKKQAKRYDDFRNRLLHGREQLLDSIIPEGFSGRWLDVGGGTGWNIEYALPRVTKQASITLLDLCDPLLDIAKDRFSKYSEYDIKIVKNDACTYSSEVKYDVISFSYSLTMMPNWFDAIENARSLLVPGGRIGVVDFFRPRKNDLSLKESKLNTWILREFVPWWFNHDDVFLSWDHLHFLSSRFKQEHKWIKKEKTAYLPIKIAHYGFLGRAL